MPKLVPIIIDENENDRECIICHNTRNDLNDIELYRKEVCNDNCNSFYHKECIEEWWKRVDNNRCLICQL